MARFMLDPNVEVVPLLPLARLRKLPHLPGIGARTLIYDRVLPQLNTHSPRLCRTSCPDPDDVGLENHIIAGHRTPIAISPITHQR